MKYEVVFLWSEALFFFDYYLSYGSLFLEDFVMLPGGQKQKQTQDGAVFSHRLPLSAQCLQNFFLIISGILIAKWSEWDAVPVMTNVAAKVTQRWSQGTWDGRAAEASCGLVIVGQTHLSPCHNELTAQGREDTWEPGALYAALLNGSVIKSHLHKNLCGCSQRAGAL